MGYVFLTLEVVTRSALGLHSHWLSGPTGPSHVQEPLGHKEISLFALCCSTSHTTFIGRGWRYPTRRL